MQIRTYVDDELERISKSNLEAALLDLQTGVGAAELSKSCKDIRAAEENDKAWERFVSDLELGAALRSAAPSPRRERADVEPGEWHVGDNPDLGLQKSAGRRKRVAPSVVSIPVNAWCERRGFDSSRGKIRPAHCRGAARTSAGIGLEIPKG